MCIVRLRVSSTVFCVLALVCARCLAAGPDFTGTWRLNPARSDIHALASAPGRILNIEQTASAVSCRITAEDGAAEDCSFTLDQKESRRSTPEGTRSSAAKFEGDALLVNTIVLPKSGGQHTEMDRWTRSRDGSTLRVRRQFVGLHDQSEALLVYEREGASAPRGDEPSTELVQRPVLRAPAPAPAIPAYVVEKGTRLPLALINSVSTKNGAPGDRIYLQTVYPILVNGRIVIPPGSFVNGTVTDVKRPGHVKGRGELYVRFDALVLPNGTSRDFRSRIGAVDGRSNEQVDRSEGTVKSEGNKSGDARTVGGATAAGTSIGTMVGAVAGHAGMGAGVGAAAGAAAGLMGVLLSRGPDAMLAAGSVVEMILDRDIQYAAEELDRPAPQSAPPAVPPGGPGPSVKDRQSTIPGRGYPF